MDNQPVQNSVPETVPAPVQIHQEKPRFPVMYLVLSVFILLFLASTAFFYYQNMQLKNILANYQTPVVSPTPTATADPTANWKTYTSSKVGFELKYPSNWTEKLPVAGDPTIIYIWSNEELGGQNGADSLKYYIFLAEEKALPTGVNYSEEIINNKTVKITTDLPSAMGCLNYFFEKSTTSYVKIVLCPFDTQKPFVKQTEYLNIFKQILSTFRFTK